MRKVIRYILGYVAVAAVLVVLLALVLALVTDEGSGVVGKEGQLAIQTEATLSAASAVHNGVNQAVLIAEGLELGWVDPILLDDSLAELTAAVGEYERRARQLEGELPIAEAAMLTGVWRAFATSATDAIASVRAGRSAPSELGARVDEAYGALVGRLVELRDTRVTKVLIAAEAVGRVGDAVRFLVVFVIPVGAMLTYRWASGRRREREALEADLAREKAINESKSEFVANVSHELRTPLTGIYGFALALAEQGLEDREMAAELTNLIVNQSAELTRMVDDLIAAGSLESEALSFTTEVVDLVDEIAHVVEPFLRAGVVIHVQTEVARGLADRLRLRQVVRNLVSNAVKHGGGRIEVATLAVESHVGLFVIDDGDGVPEEIEGRLFNRYVHEGKLPLLQGSVGLGLAIARGLVEGMGGALEYHRTDGLTCFEVRLPAAPVDMADEVSEAVPVG